MYSAKYNGQFKHTKKYNVLLFQMDNFKEISTFSFYGRKFKTLSSATDAIENASCSNSGIDVVIIPPEPYCQTDEEEFGEDDLVTSQLPHEIPSQIEIAMDDDSSDSDEEYNMPLSDIANRYKVSR